MDLCRVCLTGGSQKDIFKSEINKNDDERSFVDVFMFCLNIEVEQDTKISTKLCTNCYEKLLSFHEFKCLALRNDVYLKSLQEVNGVKNEIFLRDDDIKNEHQSMSDESLDATVKDEPKDVFDDDTDDEFLSVIKNIKYEFKEECTQKKPQKGRKRGAKTPKTKSKPIKRVCEECGKSVKDLKTHALQHLPAASRKCIPCKLCDKMFSSHSARYRHTKIKHLGAKQQCPLCDKVVAHLKQHDRLMHNRSSLPYVCASCGGRFISKSNLELHMTSHTKDYAFPCDLCDKKFNTNQRMILHKRQVHDKEKSHLCQLCSKSFFKKYHLQIHLRSHSKEKPYSCPECGKCFSTTTILKSHRLIHVEGKNYACTLCEMTFKKKSYLDIHMISHTKVKRYPCKYCGIKFGRSDHRKRHEYTAHEKNFISS
uniref:Protein krueppel n=1 Tax=Heliothis virescens TaxID=7102 RepID=A0A2A4JS95_HELVI